MEPESSGIQGLKTINSSHQPNKNSILGSQYLRNLAEEFDDTTNIVTSTLTIDKFTSSDIGEYSCRLDKDGSTGRVSVDTVILKLQG